GADPDRRRVREEHAYARHPREFRPQLVDDLIRRQRAPAARLQIDVDTRAAAAAATAATEADVRRERLDVGILLQDLHDLLDVPDQGLVADPLNRLDLAVQLTGVDARDEPFRDDLEEID